MKKILSSLALVLALATCVSAQTLANKTISTAGTDCSVSTSCAVIDVKSVTSVGLNLDVATSGTFQFEASLDATSPTNGRWFSIDDDVNAASSATADGQYFFSNPGYRFIRVRASAISGAATVTLTRGFAGLRSTATLSGASQGDGAIIDGSNATVKATVFDLANSNPLAAQIVDASGNAITSFGGGTQFAEDAASANGDVGTVSLAVRQDTLASSTSATGDYGTLKENALGRLYTSATVDAALPAGTNVIGHVIADSGSTTAVTGTVAISAAALPLPSTAATSTKQSDGSQKTQLVDSLGNVIASTSNNLNVQCANCSGSGASAADNATVTESTSTFAPVGGEFLTTPGTVTTGHQSMVAITAHRAFQVSFFDAAGNAMLGSKVSASSLPVVIASDQATIGTNVAQVAGASPSASNALPVRITDGTSFITPSTDATTNTTAKTAGPQMFGIGSTTAPTAVTTGNSVGLWTDLNGRAHVTGDSSMTALKVDGSAVTQPVSGTVTANAGTGTMTVGQATGTNLHMVCDSGCSSSAGFADNGAFTFGTTAVNPIAGVFDDVSPNTATENSAAVARITANKALHINLRNASGTEIGTSSAPVQVSLANTGSNATAVKVDGSAVTQPASPVAATSGGATPFYYISAATNNSTNKKASAGTVYSLVVINTTATLKFLRLYDLATAPTCTSNTGVVFYAPIPANSSTGAGFSAAFPVGAAFTSGIGWCITGAAGDTDNTSVAVGDVVINGTMK